MYLNCYPTPPPPGYMYTYQQGMPGVQHTTGHYVMQLGTTVPASWTIHLPVSTTNSFAITFSVTTSSTTRCLATNTRYSQSTAASGSTGYTITTCTTTSTSAHPLSHAISNTPNLKFQG